MLMEILGHISEPVYIIHGSDFIHLSSGQAAAGVLRYDVMATPVRSISIFKNTLTVELVADDEEELCF